MAPTTGRYPPKKEKQRLLRKWISAHKLLACLLGIATLIGAVIAVIPRVSLTESELADQGNSMSASFTIANSNFLPLRHVSAFLRICQAYTAPVREFLTLLIPKESCTNCNLRIGHGLWSNHSLDMEDRFTITPSAVFGLRTEAADIFIEVDYRPWFIPWDRQKCFRFRTHTQTNGDLRWYAVPPN
jgi:hypothetical protein